MYKFIVLTTLFTSGCASFSPQGDFQQPFDRATPTADTATFEELVALPAPSGAIPAAIYQFRDQTGQYKPDPSNNLSTAVTQGAESILVKALLDSRWFVPLERSGLQNILTERKIAQTEKVEKGGNQSTLPSMSAARVVFEGSIVSYDSNTRTGGSGLRLLGVGGSHTYREDRVTINLRVVNIENGTILHSVNSTKTIFSRQLSSGIFSFVDEDKLLEAEAGYSYNEPAHLAVVEAIESALINIIVDGIVRNTWTLADIQGISNDAFDRYISDSERDQFLSQKTAQADAAEERRRIAYAVRDRMKRGFAGANKFHEDSAEEWSKFRRKAAAKVVREHNRNNLKQSKKSQTIANNSNQSKNIPVSRSVYQSQQEEPIPQMIIPPHVVDQQAQALLKLQAELQIRAAQQAYENAMYARELLKKQRNTQQQSNSASSTSSDVTANPDTSSDRNTAGNRTSSNTDVRKPQAGPVQASGNQSRQSAPQPSHGKPYQVRPPLRDVSMR